MYEVMSLVSNGARQIMKAQAVNANNLANASTTGFKAELAHLTGALNVDSLVSSADLSPGGVVSTGRDLDISLDGPGWIAVVGPDGTEAYSRRGDLQVDAFGQMTNGSGAQVIGNNGPIALPPFASVEIADDGTISIRPLGSDANALAVIDRIKLVLPEDGQLNRGEDGMMHTDDGTELPADASVKVISRALEGSNVNAVGEMVKMIELARQFEGQIQLMQAAEENASVLAKLMSMN